MAGDIGKGSPWRGRGGRGGGGRPTVRCLYERAVRTTCRERQTEKETEDKRGSVSPTPAPRPHPPPGPALDVQATFSQGAHSAKLGHSLKPSDASHQPAPDKHMNTQQPASVAAQMSLICHAPGTPQHDQAHRRCKCSHQQTRNERALQREAEATQGEAKQASPENPREPLLQDAHTEGQSKIPPSMHPKPSGQIWSNPAGKLPTPAVCLKLHQICLTGLKYQPLLSLCPTLTVPPNPAPLGMLPPEKLGVEAH